MAQFILSQQEQAVMWVTLNRPDVHNALCQSLVNEISNLCDDLAKDNSVRAVIFTGQGEKAFCAGADLKERQGMNEAQTLAFVEKIQNTFQKIAELPMPTIAAINGVAFGGGLELALACDMRIMNSNALVGLTECSLGIIPGAGGTQRLPVIVGFARAMELIFTAKRVSGAEALVMGLVTTLANDSQDTKTKALEQALSIAKNAPLAVRAAKEALIASLEKGLRNGLVAELSSYHEILHSHDRKEGIKAFLAKRNPQFLGK